MQRAGFTLIELLIVFAMSAIVFASIGILSIGTFPKSQLAIESAVVVQTVRQAQSKSVSGTHDAAWGVFMSSNALTLFAGETYATRQTEFDRIHVFPNDVTVSGLGEIHFSAKTGIPDVSGDISLLQSSTGKTLTLNLNEAGTIQ